MAENEPVPAQELTLESLAEGFGRSVAGRALTAEETAALASIFNATAQALRHGFITRLAEQVKAERETESVEEFFGNLKSD
ncbi:hypothetical protein [Singulisphaera sp. PoT]|uniref:hypothetical protein n=1 Tax=Singulisphaera sp. PoT TaxID=3411797 RepID=UPI003BF54389